MPNMASLFTSLLLATSAMAIPAPATLFSRSTNSSSDSSSGSGAHAAWDAGAVTQYPIHSSCNATQRRQIELGLNETIAMADHAKAHILRWGNESDIYRKYFGNRPTFEAAGAYDAVVNANKEGVLFRCDNPDGNCDIDGWAGHWRGENATSETVICELSYHVRRSLNTMCGLGYTVANSDATTFWAADLLHRLFHVPAIGQLWVEHYADGYDEVLELAKSNETTSTHDSETLQFFALEAWAFDVAVPGVGCAGEKETEGEGEGEESGGDDIPENCHTHDGGELHCT